MVIDASALLAFLNQEPGADVVAKALEEPCYLSVVSFAEVVGRMVRAGEPVLTTTKTWVNLPLKIDIKLVG
jgi:ribonuclease VapC